MKFTLKKFASFFFIAFFASCATINPKNNMAIMSFNIRCGYCEKAGDINHWDLRKNRIYSILNKYSPQILGLQEAEEFQVNDILKNLNSKNNNFLAYGIGREIDEKGERNTIIWNKNKFALINKETIWLNENMAKFELGWDAKYRRTATIIEFYEIGSNKIFFVINTHLDNSGEMARIKSAQLLNEYLNKKNAKNIILMGDFNDVPSSKVHKEFSKIFLDTYLKNKTNKNDYSFNGFGKDEKPGNIIDFIMLKGNISNLGAKIIYDKIDGNFASDHFPIITDIELK